MKKENRQLANEVLLLFFFFKYNNLMKESSLDKFYLISMK